MSPPEVRVGAHVFTSDHRDLGVVTEVTNTECFVEQHGLLHHQTRSLLLSDVRSATADRVEVAPDGATVDQRWNVITLQDAHGRDRHVIQVGRPPSAVVPTYDEVQTTTGGPPTGEADR